MTLKLGALTKLGLFFPVVCLIRVFDQTLAEQLYRDKGLLLTDYLINHLQDLDTALSSYPCILKELSYQGKNFTNRTEVKHHGYHRPQTFSSSMESRAARAVSPSGSPVCTSS